MFDSVHSDDGLREIPARKRTPEEQRAYCHRMLEASRRATLRRDAVQAWGVWNATLRLATDGQWYLVLEDGTICCPVPDGVSGTSAYWDWKNAGAHPMQGVELLPPTDGYNK